MAINRNFGGSDIRFPSGSGMSSDPCPKCNKKELYVRFSWYELLDKAVTFVNCFNKDCLYNYSSLTDEDRKKLDEFRADQD